MVEEWQLVRLGDVTQIVMGQSPPGVAVIDWDGEAEYGDGLPFIQGNAEFGIKFPCPLKWCVTPTKSANRGDILISVRAPVGETNRTDAQLGIGRGLAAIRFDESCQAFGWHVVNHAKVALERVTQGSTFQAIGNQNLRSLPLLLPPLPEQRAIANILDSIDHAIEAADALVSSTEQLRDSLLHNLLTRGLPGRHTQWKEVLGLGTIPTDWSLVRLGDVAETTTSGSRAWSPYFRATGSLFVRSQNISGGMIDRSDAIFVQPPDDAESIRTRIQRDDLLVSITGEPGKVTVAEDNLGQGLRKSARCLSQA